MTRAAAFIIVNVVFHAPLNFCDLGLLFLCSSTLFLTLSLSVPLSLCSMCSLSPSMRFSRHSLYPLCFCTPQKSFRNVFLNLSLILCHVSVPSVCAKCLWTLHSAQHTSVPQSLSVGTLLSLCLALLFHSFN